MIPVRFKGSTIMMALLMLLMIGLSVKDSKAGLATAEPICPGAGDAFKVGWLDFTVNPIRANFIGANLFLAEREPVGVTGGVDWFYASIFSFTGSNVIPEIAISGNDLVFFGSFLNTTITGSQLISKYNQKDTRNTYIEVANTARGVCAFGFPDFGPLEDVTEEIDPFPRECGDSTDCIPGANECDDGFCELTPTVACTDDVDCNPCVKDPVEVHVEILNEACNEVCDFCDAFTPRDKYVYDLSNLTRNIDGSAVGCSDNVQETEGIFVVTAVKNCESQQQARDYNFLYGDMRLIDPRLPADYGENLQTRLAISSRGSCRVSGESCWFDESLNFPDFTCEGDNCIGDVVGVCNTEGNKPCILNEDCNEGGAGGPVTCNAIAGEQLTSFGTCSQSGRTGCQNVVNPCNFGCGEFNSETGVCEVSEESCDSQSCDLSFFTCIGWNSCESNNECILDGSGCSGFGLDPSNHCLTGELGCELVSYLPRFIRKDFSVEKDDDPAGADVVKLAIFDVYSEAAFGFRYRVGRTSLGDNALVSYSEDICDDAENCHSCGDQTSCYHRLGINDALPLIDPPNPIVSPTPTPTPTPPPCTSDADCTFPDVCDLLSGMCEPIECTEDEDCPAGAVCSDFVEPDTGICIPGCTEDHPCPAGQECVGIDPDTGVGMCQPIPTPTPTPTTPTPTPTVSKNPNQGSSGCGTSLVSGAAPGQLGTAMANILIPLLPALAIGVRMIRRKKKGQK